jgi:hypothetical protein
MANNKLKLGEIAVNTKPEEHLVSLRMKKRVVELVDAEREKFSTPRSSWIIQAVVEKLQRLGYEMD